MEDAARKWTDKELERMEKDIRSIYNDRLKYITREWNEYMKRGNEKLAKLYSSYMRTGDSAAKEEYEKALKDYTIYDVRYREMIKDTTYRLAHVNQIALDYANGQLPQIYTVNYNEANNLGLRFSVINEDVVRRRIVEGDIKLPNKKINIPKDMRWNTKSLNSSVLQGILVGESMNKIAKRIKPIVDNNEAAAIRNARTMVTGAENIGRLDSYKRLCADGVVLQKMWIATDDGKTRAWHVDLDGQIAELDEPFIDGHGNEIMYPGDPGAEPETVYNCRCTMTSVIKGFDF